MLERVVILKKVLQQDHVFCGLGTRAHNAARSGHTRPYLPSVCNSCLSSSGQVQLCSQFREWGMLIVLSPAGAGRTAFMLLWTGTAVILSPAVQVRLRDLQVWAKSELRKRRKGSSSISLNIASCAPSNMSELGSPNFVLTPSRIRKSTLTWNQKPLWFWKHLPNSTKLNKTQPTIRLRPPEAWFLWSKQILDFSLDFWQQWQ